MKRTVLFLMLAALLPLAASAQNPDMPSYIDSTMQNFLEPYKHIYTIPSYGAAAYIRYELIEDSTAEGITIYGFAISAMYYDLHKQYPDIYHDSTLDRDNWLQYTCLFKRIEDSMVLVAKAPYNQFGTPTYTLPPKYIGANSAKYLDSIYVLNDSIITPPMFETYFDTARYITDSFWFGRTCRSDLYGSTYFDVITDLCPVFEDCNCDATEFMQLTMPFMKLRRYLYYNTRTTYRPQGWIGDIKTRRMFFFPILTPDPNRTTPTPVDTVLNYFDTTSHAGPGHSAVYSPQMMERYTQLMPSAARAGQQVAVLSSFHLQAIELYDAAGRLVQRQPASGIGATIQTADLPAGNYLVRLLTTAGSVTKKLLLQ